jgi:ring-1,2-phenylacetyl-CoA epoxidase subunit PaaE
VIHFHSLRIKDIKKETSESVSIAFDIPATLEETFQFTQGQNITLKATISGEEIRRSYSICSSPLDKELRVAVKKVPGGKFSTYANSKLRKGDTLEVMPPTGKFYTPLDPAQSKNYLAFAAGSGITPLLSIIKTTLATEPESTFTLVYGNRNRSSIIFKEELEALKNKYIQRFRLYHILSRERTEAAVNSGRINREKCSVLFDKLVDLPATDEFFLCGPEEMIFSVRDWLLEHQVAEHKIHFELFTTPGQASAEKSVKAGKDKTQQGKTSQVTIKLDGVTFDFELPYNGESILDGALDKSADLPYACKGGVCCTCRARLIEGAVEMDVNYALEPDEIAAGFILTCQAHPRTEKVVVDFDVK